MEYSRDKTCNTIVSRSSNLRLSKYLPNPLQFVATEIKRTRGKKFEGTSDYQNSVDFSCDEIQKLRYPQTTYYFEFRQLQTFQSNLSRKKGTGLKILLQRTKASFLPIEFCPARKTEDILDPMLSIYTQRACFH